MLLLIVLHFSRIRNEFFIIFVYLSTTLFIAQQNLSKGVNVVCKGASSRISTSPEMSSSSVFVSLTFLISFNEDRYCLYRLGDGLYFLPLYRVAWFHSFCNAFSADILSLSFVMLFTTKKNSNQLFLANSSSFFYTLVLDLMVLAFACLVFYFKIQLIFQYVCNSLTSITVAIRIGGLTHCIIYLLVGKKFRKAVVNCFLIRSHEF